MLRNELAHLEIFGFVAFNRGKTLVAETFRERDRIGAHNRENLRSVRENRFEFIDLCEELVEFAREFLDFEANELDQAQRANGIGLHARESHTAVAVGEGLSARAIKRSGTSSMRA